VISKAVLFAPSDGYGWRHSARHRPHPASSELALLPVGNKPLVLHALEELIDAGIDEVAVVAAPSVADDVRELVDDSVGEYVATLEVTRGDALFVDALKQVAPFLGGDSFVVHLGDSLTHAGLGEVLRAPDLDENDALALVEKTGSEATPLGAGLASRRAAGVYVFGPSVLELAAEPDVPADWDVEIATAAERLAATGGRLELRPVNDWWRYRQRPDALLQANRFFLSGLRGGPTDACLEDTELQGPVALHPTAQLSSAVVRGPVIIGPHVEIRDAYIGPYTSIGPNVLIENSEVEHSIILADASIRHLGVRLEGSIVGRHARIFRDFRLPRAVRLNVGDGAAVAIT
jgi:glucose-1-phosphate thymidylyltransferase